MPADDVPGFDSDPELDELLTRGVGELDEETRIEVQRYKARYLKAKRDAGMSASRPPWWEGDEAPETVEETDQSGADLEAAPPQPESEPEEEPVEATQEPSPEQEEEAGETPEEPPAEPEEEPEPAAAEASGNGSEPSVPADVDFEEDPEMEELLEKDVFDLDEDTRVEVQLYKSRKMQAREAARSGGDAETSEETETEQAPAGATRNGSDDKVAPPAEGEGRYRGERKIKELVESRTTGRDVTRRGFLSSFGLGVMGFLGVLSVGTAAAGRFFYPNVQANPPEQFVAGEPEDYPTNTVSTRFKSQYRIWIVNLGDRIVSILAICTHLGCTPNWLDGQGIFKCPCHGSGYYMTGVNFEGPAPRPMDRVAIRLNPQGKLIVDKSQVFSAQAQPGWDAKSAYIAV